MSPGQLERLRKALWYMPDGWGCTVKRASTDGDYPPESDEVTLWAEDIRALLQQYDDRRAMETEFPSSPE